MLSRDLTADVAPCPLVGGGEMGERIRAHNWAATPLGLIGCWSQSLRAAVNLVVATGFPSILL